MADDVEQVRLVHEDALGNRWWWEIRRHRATVVLRHGQEGRSGELRSRTWASAEAAAMEADRTIASRLALGYRREEPPPPVPPAEGAVDADPTDEAAWAVYADWLVERGDPRGERLAAALAGDPTAAEELARPWAHSSGLDVRHGFVVRARFTEIDPADSLGTGFGQVLSVVGKLRRLARDPDARFLQRLEVDSYGPVLDLASVLVAAAPRWPLRELRIVERSEGTPHDLGPLLALFPRLERLGLEGPAAVLGAFEAPRLRSLSKRRLSAADLDGLAHSRLPSLRRLRLERGLSSEEQLERAVAGRDLELLGLRRARIRGVGAVLASLPVARGLVELDLRQCGLTASDVVALLHGPFEALRAVDVRGNDLPPALLAALATRFALVTDPVSLPGAAGAGMS